MATEKRSYIMRLGDRELNAKASRVAFEHIKFTNYPDDKYTDACLEWGNVSNEKHLHSRFP